MRVPHTFTIDDMPECERPRRTIFYNRPQPPQPAAESAKPAESAEPEDPANPPIKIQPSDWAAFQQLMMDALRPFVDARAALAAAFREFREQHGGPLYEPA